MLILFLFLVLICLYGIKINLKFDSEYMSKSKTECIKGIFVLIVLFSHLRQYVDLSVDIWVKTYDFILSLFGQSMVVVFLIYSGYGVGESIKRRGAEYVRGIPRKRILKTWYNFLIALVPFVMINLILQLEQYTFSDYLLSMFALHSIGNSTWFVFAIIVCWGATYMAYTLCKDDRASILLLTCFLIVYICIIVQLKDGRAWFDTVFCYVGGILLSHYKKRINCFFEQNVCTYILIGLSGIGWLFFRIFMPNTSIVSIIGNLIFAVFIIALTTRITFQNQILEWLGKHVFSIYMLQRIPMIVLSYWQLNRTNKGMFVFLCILLTLCLAEVYEKVIKYINKICQCIRSR